MPTEKRTIGTDAVLILLFEPNSEDIAKVTLQNVGATNFYWGHDKNVNSDNGHYLPPNGVFTDDMALEPIWVVSSGAGGDLRVTIQRYLNSNVMRIVE